MSTRQIRWFGVFLTCCAVISITSYEPFKTISIHLTALFSFLIGLVMVLGNFKKELAPEKPPSKTIEGTWTCVD